MCIQCSQGQYNASKSSMRMFWVRNDCCAWWNIHWQHVINENTVFTSKEEQTIARKWHRN